MSYNVDLLNTINYIVDRSEVVSALVLIATALVIIAFKLKPRNQPHKRNK